MADATSGKEIFPLAIKIGRRSYRDLDKLVKLMNTNKSTAINRAIQICLLVLKEQRKGNRIITVDRHGNGKELQFKI